MTQDVIIVGAPRSGTNMLRDVLTSVPGFGTWPCDEVNLLWRHGNRDHPDDELSAEHARSEVRDYLRRAFDKIRRREGAEVVVEKTCATSLRVEFTRAVFPDAKYVFITRDGLDAAASAMQRWNAPLDLGYTARKARFVPASDLPFYGSRFLLSTIRRSRTPEGEVGTWWGPKPRDYRQIMATHSLDEVCLLQWQRCVDRSEEGLAGLGPDQLLHVSYEEFVADPVEETRSMLEFLGRPDADPHAAAAQVSGTSVGKGRRQLGEDAVARLAALGGTTLARHAHV